jgi:hypothetical protein
MAWLFQEGDKRREEQAGGQSACLHRHIGEATMQIPSVGFVLVRKVRSKVNNNNNVRI